MRDTEDAVEEFYADYRLSHVEKRFFEKLKEYHRVQDDSQRNGNTRYGPAFNAMVKQLVEQVLN